MEMRRVNCAGTDGKLLKPILDSEGHALGALARKCSKFIGIRWDTGSAGQSIGSRCLQNQFVLDPDWGIGQPANIEPEAALPLIACVRMVHADSEGLLLEPRANSTDVSDKSCGRRVNDLRTHVNP